MTFPLLIDPILSYCEGESVYLHTFIVKPGKDFIEKNEVLVSEITI